MKCNTCSKITIIHNIIDGLVINNMPHIINASRQGALNELAVTAAKI